jgi:hypothetical protein
MAGRLSSISSQMDRLYEFDREPVSPDKLHSGGKFAGLFAGEHVAAPVIHFLGKLSSDSSKLVFLAASVGWFVFATLWARRR